MPEHLRAIDGDWHHGKWGLVGFLGFDAVSSLFGEMIVPIRLLCRLVGIAALYDLLSLPLE